jgi:hypothetical protein
MLLDMQDFNLKTKNVGLFDFMIETINGTKAYKK